MGSLLNKFLELEKKPQEEKEIIPGEKKIKIESLKPPMAPKPIKKEEIPKDLENTIKELITKEFQKLIQENLKSFSIDYDKISKGSDRVRERYQLITGKTWRGKTADALKELEKLYIIRSPDFSNVIKDLKINFQNGFLRPSQIK